MSPLTTLKRLQRHADKLPIPTQAGVWCVALNGPTFLTTKEKGVLAWEVCEDSLKPSKLGFRFCQT